ncbi:DUF2062 domain-containing protein [filamentous cyanobacterium CCP5]|nr:DUF2062 domain-containing protein [filamentous cyanobacterium CCP5]
MSQLIESQPDSKRTTRAKWPLWRRRVQYFYLRFLRLRGSPQELSRGIASGVFAGCFPLFGLQTLIGVGVATVFRGNKVLAAASTWISNPFTYLPIFAFNYQVGEWLLGRGSLQNFDSLDSLKSWMEMGTDVTTRLMLGSAVVGIVVGLISYYLGIRVINRLRQRRRSRQQALHDS